MDCDVRYRSNQQLVFSLRRGARCSQVKSVPISVNYWISSSKIPLVRITGEPPVLPCKSVPISANYWIISSKVPVIRITGEPPVLPVCEIRSWILRLRVKRRQEELEGKNVSGTPVNSGLYAFLVSNTGVNRRVNSSNFELNPEKMTLAIFSSDQGP